MVRAETCSFRILRAKTRIQKSKYAGNRIFPGVEVPAFAPAKNRLSKCNGNAHKVWHFLLSQLEMKKITGFSFPHLVEQSGYCFIGRKACARLNGIQGITWVSTVKFRGFLDLVKNLSCFLLKLEVFVFSSGVPCFTEKGEFEGEEGTLWVQMLANQEICQPIYHL